MGLEFIKLNNISNAPMELLLLADPSEAMIRKYLFNGVCYTAIMDNKTVGVLVFKENESNSVEIMNIAVQEEFQRNGIGKKLLQHVINEIKNTNIKTIEIGTGNSSVFQLLLYQKCGFRISSIDKDFFRKNYNEKIFENGIECRDMIRLKINL